MFMTCLKYLRQTRAARRLMQTVRTMYGEKSEFIEDIFKAETDIDVSMTERRNCHIYITFLISG